MADDAKVAAILEWLKEKNALNISTYDVSKTSGYTDVIIVCEGQADLHNQAIANHLLTMARNHGMKVISKEGIEHGHWILIDVADVIVHIFLNQTRRHYDIDELFAKVRDLDPEGISK
ncbi:MAG TPA: ribosome silencing factor [Candidatus Cloacimonetes bacterium]|mgnify:FL=1|nr:ribosome silencing factor [Candidatus Cloacimonas sp.]HHZ15110.1 ribosome silencing factor [Candidatus Cloacimonadota bacterium]